MEKEIITRKIDANIFMLVKVELINKQVRVFKHWPGAAGSVPQALERSRGGSSS